MPVDDMPVHGTVRHERPPSGCYNATNRIACRQIGRRTPDGWVPLIECVGCETLKDRAYIENARAAIEREMSQFMKADQRLK